MQNYRVQTAPRAEVLNAFMRGVYSWMSIGLALTAGVAWYLSKNEAFINLLMTNRMVLFGLIIAQFGTVMWLSFGIRKMSGSKATTMFMVYSALTGATFSILPVIYPAVAIAKAFVTTAGMFGAMSIYGMTTKRDLTGVGSFAIMGLFGLIIAMVVNFFLQSAAMDFVISGLGVVIFTLLTAYDTQKLKVMGESAPANDGTAVRRGVILGALTLYLDFINLFLFLLRFFGGGRD